MDAALLQIKDWAAELEALCERLAPRFGRIEVRRRAGAFLHGLLSGAERKNGWQLAEQAGDPTPMGCSGCSTTPAGIPTRSATTCATTSPSTWATPAGCWWWTRPGSSRRAPSRLGCSASTRARPRCREAGIPDEVGFRTKPQLARRMLERALDAGVPVGWVTADEVYGQDGRLRRWLEERDQPHVLAVNCKQSLVSGLFRFERADQLAARIPAGAWRHYSAGQGAKGERVYAWARVAIRPLREPGRGHWLLLRRSLASGELAYYLCYGPAQTSLAELVRVAGIRWTVECGFQQAKGQTGLDHYEVRRYQAWYRHVTLSMLAQAFLAVMRAKASTSGSGGN